MKRGLIFMALCLCFAAIASYSATVWSSDVAFDGTPTSDTVVLKPTDNIGYSTALINGQYKEWSIRIRNNSTQQQYFYQHGGPVVSGDLEGTVNWNYTTLQLDKNATYKVSENLMSTSDEVDSYRLVTIVPEPAALLLIGIVGAFFLRRRAKALLAFLAAVVLCSFSANATTTVSSVTCSQLWPIHRQVVINYTITTDSAEDLTIKFYGSTDKGATTFNLDDKGTLTKDGASGKITTGSGTYKTIWTPDSTLNNVTGTIRIGVEAEEYVPPQTYMVVDLANNCDISYLDDVPSGGWTDTYKTTKMVFRYIPAGSFSMGSPSGEEGRQGNEDVHLVTLTKSFYMGVFEVTQKQYELIAGSNPSSNQGDPRPVENVSYNTLRGSVKGAEWPTGTDVDAGSFIGTFRSQTGCDFDLPTEAQWEYACRATTTTALNTGSNLSDESSCPEMDEAGRYFNNTTDRKGDPYYLQHTTVGCYLPNQWGLYDMHGNVAELCLDWKTSRLGTNPVTDPVGPTTGDTRIARGGCYQREALDCRSAARTMSAYPSVSGEIIGFRLILTLE